jgi:hypothetical protein
VEVIVRRGFRGDTALLQSPFLEDDKHRADDHCEADQIVPAQVLFQVENREDRKDGESDDLLNGLQLCRREFVGADAVGGNLKAVFRKCDQPTDQDDLGQRSLPVFQVSVPGEGHEDV